MSIPKLIHYVWVGNEMPEKHKKLLNINKQVLNNYQFILWNEEKIFSEIKNTELEYFVTKAFSENKFAFLSDAVKLFALKKYGGWAIDADVEIVKDLTKFENYSWVSGFEVPFLPITAVWGARLNHTFTDLLLSKYYDRSNYSWIVGTANTNWISKILIENGCNANNQYQYVKTLDVHLYPSNVFCDPRSDESYAIHHFTGSWL